MELELSFADFRGFQRQDYVKIRPITLLVGENSAGKTSFLAGLKYAIDFQSGFSEPSFNNDPFQLGTFDQIAHYRGGRGGRARNFKISTRQSVNVRRGRGSETSGTFEVEINIHFGSSESQASVSSVTISSEQKSLEASVVQDGVQITFITEKNERFPLDEPSSIPPIARTDFARYWPFLLRDLRFRVRRHAEGQSGLFDDLQAPIAQLSDLADAVTRRSSGLIEATSAIRTKPQRTYTPGTESEDGEGGHVPYEIAKRYRGRTRDREGWETLKLAIEDFGKQSGMYKDIWVKSFGRTASDPFQIQFSSDGPRMNLMDLGYGTSQVLPILYGIAGGRRGGYFLIQQPEVHLHPKAQAALGQYFVSAQQTSGIHFVLETHSDFIVDRVRASIAEKLISHNDVSLLFFERGRLENKIIQIELNELGEPVDPPDSYRAFFLDEQMKLLGI